MKKQNHKQGNQDRNTDKTDVKLEENPNIGENTGEDSGIDKSRDHHSDEADSASEGGSGEEDSAFVTEEERLKAVSESLAKALEEEENAPKDSKDAVIDDLNDKLMRQRAEFDNYRKRTEKEKSGMFELGAKNIIEKILPTIDNFERALAAVPPDKEAEAFAQGVEMIYKKMLKDLEDAGVSAIVAVGQPFDPNLHHAVMHVEDESVGESTVIEEFQKGYLYKGNVVRYSMVKVAN